MSVPLLEIKASIVLASVFSHLCRARRHPTRRGSLSAKPRERLHGPGRGRDGLYGFRDLDRSLQIVNKMLAASRLA